MSNPDGTAIVPFAEPPWLRGMPSPYYKASHIKWQKDTREFADRVLNAHAMEWETAETIPSSVYGEFVAAGVLPATLPAPLPVALLKSLGITHLLGGLPVEDFDVLHGAIFQDNILRSGLMGPPGAITTGIAFGTPPIYKFGSKELQKKFLPDILTGKKRICIAITEPGSGSDVMGTSTTAVKTADGKFYIVNGIKKW
jgi:acyl-CoA dehydrogenase